MSILTFDSDLVIPVIVGLGACPENYVMNKLRKMILRFSFFLYVNQLNVIVLH